MENIKRTRARSYEQYCGLARGLDAVGDRWNLLIVRDLLVGPMRFNELRASLPGIATNLLAQRLRDLADAGVVERRLAGAATVYALTPWGAGLREPIEALARWAMPLMAAGRGGDAFEPRWLGAALPGLLRGVTSDREVELGFEVDGVLIAVRVDEHGPHAFAGPDERPHTVLAAGPETVLGLAAGAITVDEALDAGGLTGDAEVLRRLFPDGRAG